MLTEQQLKMLEGIIKNAVPTDETEAVVINAFDELISEIRSNRESTNLTRSTKPTNRLTDTERHVLRLIACGHTDREIAPLVGLSEGHVSKYVVVIIKAKLNAKTRAHAVWLAVQAGEFGRVNDG